ncbi:uncharacterized protein LOC114460732 [Gouania willdenowi]|uniref:uncharacterized protein LOC114460732 n=1 Tax=Gouania willdenowi TaxID=441366 RepID=UPI001056D5F8|nr:uncharacterized protein LOC114460732 [Gouania willdenowi]
MEQLAENTPETPTAELRTPPHHHKVSRKARLSFPTPDYSKVKPRVQFPRGQYKPPEPKNKAPLSFPTPDYSKVKCRVKFPDQYKPPKRQRPLREGSLSPQAPLPIESPANLVRKVLEHTADGCSSSDISSPQQAITLVDQLQGLCHLSETLDSLVKSFLLTKKELRRLKKQHRADLGCLDPTRMLKAQIYYSVYLMRKLKKYQEQLCETPPPSFPVQPVCSSTPRTPPQFPADPVEMKELRSTREGSDDDYKHTLTSHFLPPLSDAHTHMDHVRLFRCDSIESISAEESSRNPPSVFHPPTNASTAQQEKSGRSRSLYCSSPQRVTCSSISSISSRMRSNVQPPALMSRSTQTSAAVERSSRTPQHHCCSDSAPHRVRPVKSQHNRALFLRQFLPGCPPQKLFYPSPHSGSRLGFRGHTEATPSLDRAIRAAESMKRSSSRMVDSLSAGLHLRQHLATPALDSILMM